MFQTELQLYEDDKEHNHSLRTKSQPVHVHLFRPNDLHCKW